MIKFIWNFLRELGDFFSANFDPWRDSVDILLVTVGIYWLLLLIQGTRAIQILVGLSQKRLKSGQQGVDHGPPGALH